MVGFDKVKHFFVGYAISFLFILLFNISLSSAIIGLFISSVAGIVWEVAQKFKIIKGNPNINDVYATMFGGFIASITLYIFMILKL